MNSAHTTNTARDPDDPCAQESARAPRRWATGAAALVALLLGAIASVALVAAFTVFDDPCPGYDDEGPMAAPDSPYVHVMCDSTMALQLGPMTQVPVPWALLISTAIGVTAATLLVWRRPRVAARRSLATGLVGVLLLQPAVVVALQYALPRDCLSGAAETGECVRDRELS